MNENREVLDVVNCAALWREIVNFNVYSCPTEGAAYNHKKCNYFGAYKEKRVFAVAEIEAVVDVYLDGLLEIKWINGDESEETYVERAVELVGKLRKDRLSQRMFLLKNLSSTDFVKDTKGGMFGSKMYFDVEKLKIADAVELAQKLRGRTWSEIKTSEL